MQSIKNYIIEGLFDNNSTDSMTRYMDDEDIQEEINFIIDVIKHPTRMSAWNMREFVYKFKEKLDQLGYKHDEEYLIKLNPNPVMPGKSDIDYYIEIVGPYKSKKHRNIKGMRVLIFHNDYFRHIQFTTKFIKTSYNYEDRITRFENKCKDNPEAGFYKLSKQTALKIFELCEE
jgi:hypothetical protein